jgi:hypothetical protein
MALEGTGISEAKSAGGSALFCAVKEVISIGRRRTFIVVKCGAGGSLTSAKVWSGVLGSFRSVGAKLRGNVILIGGRLLARGDSKSGEDDAIPADRMSDDGESELIVGTWLSQTGYRG